ncbi:hypothetical protein PSKAS_20720 [Peribacillus sp. N1]
MNGDGLHGHKLHEESDFEEEISWERPLTSGIRDHYKKTGSHVFQVSLKAIFIVSLTIMISSLVGMTMTFTGE